MDEIKTDVGLVLLKAIYYAVQIILKYIFLQQGITLRRTMFEKLKHHIKSYSLPKDCLIFTTLHS